MDFHSMKRKELQSLCKKHKIPANLSNLEMAKRLTEFTKENEKSLARGGRNKVQGENVSETESTNVMNKKAKKVRFSPEHEFIEFTRSVQIKRRSRRNSISSGNSTLSVENVGSGEMSNEIVDSPCKVTGARGSKLVEVSVNEKRGRKGVKRSNQNTNGAATETLNNCELSNAGVDNPGRVTRLRRKTIVEAVVDASKRETKRAKTDDKRGKKALDNVDDDKLIEEIVDIPVRLTRSRNQKLTESSSKEMRKSKVEKNNDNVALASAVNDDNGVVTTRSTRNRRVVNERMSVKNNEKGSDDKKIGEVHVMVEPQILLRRSKRKVNGVADSEMSNDDTGKHENKAIKGFRKTPMSLTVEGSRVDEESGGSKIDPDRKLEVVLQHEEPIKLEARRSNRRSVMPIAELKTENEDRCVLRRSVPQSEIAGGICKDEENVLQPARVTRRSRRKTSVLNVVSADEKFDTVVIVENFETSKHVSKPCAVEKGSPSMKTNARRSRRNVSNYESVEVIDESGGDSIVQQKSESHGDAIDSFATTRKQPSSLKERHSLDASSCEGLLENGESLFVDYQLAVSATIINPVSVTNSSAENIISEVGLTSSNRTLREKQHGSISDSVVTADTKLINANELVNLEETAQSRTAELKMDIDCRKEISASKLGDVEKVKSSLEFDVHEETEENISDADKSEPEALVFSQTENSNFHNKIDTKVLPEGSNVHENTGFAETSSLADSVLLGHQIDSQNDLGVIEDEGEKHIQPSLHAINHIGKVEGVFVQKNLNSVEPGHTNEISWSIACEPKDEISEQNNEDTVSKAGEADVHIHSTDEKSELQLKEPLSGKLRKSLEGDKIDGNRGIDHKSTDEDSEFNLCYLFDEERSARIIPQHRRFFSGEYLVLDSDEQGISENSLAVSPTSICPNSTEVQVKRGVEADHTAKTDESPLGNSIQPESGETDGSGSSKNQKRKCDDDEEFGVYNLFVEDRVISSDENVVEPIHCSEIMLMGDNEASKIAEGEETSVHKNINPESAGSSEGGCLQDQNGSKDEHRDFNISDLFDSGKSVRMTPRDRGTFSAEYSIKGSDEQGMFHDSPAVSTMSANSTEVNICAVSSHLQERVPSEPDSVSKSQGYVPITFDMCGTTENEDTDQENEATNSRSKMPRDEMSVERNVRDGEHESFNQGDDRTNRDTHELAVQPKSSFATPTAMENTTIQGQEAWSGGSETAGNAMSILKISVKGKASEMVEGDEMSRDEMSMGRTIKAGGHANFYQGDEHTNIDTYEPAVRPNSSFSSPTTMENSIHGQEACSGGSETVGNYLSILRINDKGKASEMVEDDEMSRDEMSMGRTIRAEEHELFNQGDEHTNRDRYEPAEQPNSPLFTLAIANTIQGQKTWSGESETAGNAMSISKTNDKGKANEMVESVDNLENAIYPNCGKEKEDFDDSRISDVAIYMDYSKVGAESNSRDLLVTNIVPDASEEPTNVESSKSWAENDLKLLFATPIKVLATCNDDGTSADDRALENAVVCKSGENIGEIGSELENNLRLENSLPYNGEDIADGELKEVQNVELVNPSEAVYDGCKAIEEQWTENTCDSMRKANFSVGQSLFNEATCDGNETMEKDISSAGLLSSLDKVGGCHDMLVDTDLLGELSCGSEGEMVLHPDAGFRISDNADFQKSNTSENIHLFTACYEDVNITNEVLIDTCDVPVDPEIAKIGSFSDQKDVGFDKGIPSGTFSKASHCDDEITEWKHEKSIIKHDDSYSAKIWDNTDDNLRSSHEILDEEVDNVVPPAEHASSICGSESITLNNTGMHLLLGDNGGDDIEKSEAEASFFNLEEKIVNLNNDVSAVSDEPASGCNEILKESDVDDTIKQYIDSESSVSLEFEESDVLTHIEEKNNTENGDLVVNEGSSADVDEKALVVEIEGKELEEAKKNSRTILIHATPRKLLAKADMKENAPRHKNSHVGDFTTMRPAKRRALQDVHWK